MTQTKRPTNCKRLPSEDAGGLNRRGIEDSDVVRERCGDEVRIDARECARGHLDVGLRQHLEPFGKPIGIELLIAARSRSAPEIEIEHAGKLLWSGKRHQFAGALETAPLDDPVQDLRLQLRNNPREMRRVHDAGEQRALAWSIAFGHGPAMLTASPANKQS